MKGGRRGEYLGLNEGFGDDRHMGKSKGGGGSLGV
jgi:hypothetical protein